MNASNILNKVFRERWNSEGLVVNNRSFLYKDIYQKALAIKLHLNKLGCNEGDKLILKLPNGSVFFHSYLASIIGGFTFIPINIDTTDDNFLLIKNKVNPKLIIDDEKKLGDLKTFSVRYPDFNYPINQDAGIFFTSGTTGSPKGVAHTLNNLVLNAISFNSMMGIEDTCRLYHIFPMSYMAGFLNSILLPIVSGGTVILGNQFNAMNVFGFWDDILHKKINTLWLSPTMAYMLTKINRDKNIKEKIKDKLSNIFSATAPLQAHIKKSFHETFGYYLQNSYGMSELLLVSAQNIHEAGSNETSGTMLPEILSKTEFNKQSNSYELLIKTPFMLSNYFMSDEVNYIDSKGYFITGDIAKVDDKKLDITGRIKDIIIRGGINISPREIERVIYSNKIVKEVFVIGQPDEFWGEIIIVFLSINLSCDVKKVKKEINKICKSNLPSSMMPDKFIYVDNLPKTLSGKIERRKLVEFL